MRVLFLYIILVLILSFQVSVGIAQLDTIHWMPPMHAGPGDKIDDHYIYLTTLENNPFDVRIYNGAGVLLSTENISKNNPKRYFIGDGANTDVMVPKASLMTVLSNKGLIMVAPKPFFANYRGKEPSQAEIITAKGRAAKGDEFRASCPPMEDNASTTRSFMVGIMATENNTEVLINEYNPDVKFATAGAPVSMASISITLNAGQSYVISGHTQDDAANNTGFTGALITSTKPIVMNSGLWLGSIAAGNGQDILADQAVPVCRIGTDYIVVRGEGTDAMEKPLVLAHYDNTQIYAGGNLVATINRGDHHLIDFSHWSGAAHKSMYVRTSQPAYLYQPLGGTNQRQTPGMNFIPPIPCEADIFPTSVLISDAARIGNTNYQSVLIANARAGGNFSINGVLQGAGQPITGLPGWVTYRIPNISGDLFVESSSTAAIGILGYDANAGYAGYFSGFDLLFDLAGISNSTLVSPDLYTMGGKCKGELFSGDIRMIVCNSNDPHYISSASSQNGSIVNILPTFQNKFDSSFVISPPHPDFSGLDTICFVLKTDQACDTASIKVYVAVRWFADPVVSFVSPPYSVCIGNSISIQAAGGNSYNWESGQTTATISVSPLVSQYYTVTVTDLNGCTAIDSVEVIVHPNPDALAGDDTSICVGESVILNASGGSSYAWSNSVVQGTAFYPLVTGVYTVTVTDTNGCTDVDDLLVTVHSLPNADAGANQGICYGDSVVLAASGGLTYNWSNGITNGIAFIPNTSTIYTVTVTDANSCTDIDSILVSVYPLPTAYAGADTSICLGDFVVLTATGGISYSWSNNISNGDSIYPNATDIYTVTVTDLNGCTNVDNVEVIVLTLPVANVGNDTSICHNGSLVVNASGGVYYNWSGPESFSSNSQSINLTNISFEMAGTYSLTVTDANSCSTIATIDIDVNSNPNIISTITNVLCYGDSTGQINITVNNGSPVYSYIWSNGSLNQNLSGLPIGNYSVTVTDSNNCTNTHNAIVNEPSGALSLELSSSSDVTCNGLCNGTAIVIASFGTAPYQYLWSDGSATAINNNLCSGSHLVTVIDANGCDTTLTVVINQPVSLVATITETNPASCFGYCDGNATASATGGIGTYTFLWSNGQNSSISTNLCEGIYTVTVNDSNGCENIQAVNISHPSPVVATITGTTPATCFGYCDGSATASGSGGTGANYSYVWDNGQITASATSLCAGLYIVTISDSNGCQDTVNVVINQPTQVTSQVGSQIPVLCHGSCDGVGSVNSSGGIPPYTYLWANSGYTQQTNSNLCAGNHMVTVSDLNGCTSSVQVNISSPSQISIISINENNTTCYASSDGIISVTATGGTGSYTFSLNAQTNTNGVFTGLSAGNYTVTIADENGCFITANANISQPENLIVASTPNLTLCYGQTEIINAFVSGGTPPYTYNWNGTSGSSSLQINPTNQTSYGVQVVDAHGCVSNMSITNVNITPPLLMEAFASPSSVCPGEQVMLNVSFSEGAGGPYIIRYNGDVVSLPIYVYPTQSGSYVLTGEDICGSTASASVSINVFPVPEVSFTSDVVNGCVPLKVKFNQHSSAQGQSYKWQFENNNYNQISFSANPTHVFKYPGTYTVSLTVTTIDGCNSTTVVPNMITVYPKPHAAFYTDPISANISIIKPSIQFINASYGADWYIWHFGDGDSSSTANPFHIYKQISSFDVELVAFTVHNCKDTAWAKVTVQDEFTFYAPNAFSPDNDGTNDVFFVQGHGIDESNFYMAIFDRWGQIIWETDKYNHYNPQSTGWDGTNKRNEIVKTDSYTWFVIFRDFRGNKKEYAGIVTLIR